MLADQSPLCFSSLADYSVYPVRWGPLQQLRRREMQTRLMLQQISQKESRIFMINSQKNLHRLMFKFKTCLVRVAFFFVSFMAHSGEGGCGTFYAISVSSSAFQGLSTLKQHKLVTETLKQEIAGIHGLQVLHSSSYISVCSQPIHDLDKNQRRVGKQTFASNDKRLLLVSLRPGHDKPNFCGVLSMRNKNYVFFLGLGKCKLHPNPGRTGAIPNT